MRAGDRVPAYVVTIEGVSVAAVPGRKLTVVIQIKNEVHEDIFIAITPEQCLQLSENLRDAYTTIVGGAEQFLN